MGKILDAIKRIGSREKDEEYVPKVVVDKRLDGLRRLRQVQVNEDEKVKLKEQIAEYNRERTAKHLFGIKGKLEEKKGLIKKINAQKKVNILEKRKSLLSENSLLDNQKEELPKKVNILDNNSSFLR